MDESQASCLNVTASLFIVIVFAGLREVPAFNWPDTPVIWMNERRSTMD